MAQEVQLDPQGGPWLTVRGLESQLSPAPLPRRALLHGGCWHPGEATLIYCLWRGRSPRTPPLLAWASFIWDTFGSAGILALFEMHRSETK